MEDYQRQFQSLLARATTVRPDQQVDLFTAGLNDSIRMDMEFQNPQNLATAMNLTCAYERRMQPKQSQDIRRSNTNYQITPTTTINISPKLINNTSEGSRSVKTITKGSTVSSAVSSPYIKKLKRAEMAE